jgi:hypothetical protein
MRHHFGLKKLKILASQQHTINAAREPEKELERIQVNSRAICKGTLCRKARSK